MLDFKKKINIFNTGKFRFGFLSIAAVLSLIFVSVIVEANNIRWYISPSDPYVQTWTDTTSINADDNWNNFIAINGYRGDGLTATDGVDPQTVLIDGETTPLDVNANQSNPNTFSAGGVTEFDGIANPTIAMKGSGTADAPHLVIQLNKESCPNSKFLSVSYKVRDLDSSANNAIQRVALHYRVGTTGNYTNVPGAYVADATEPNAATKVSNVVGMLPHIPAGDDIVYLRIMTTNAVGTDEYVGIDDINVGCFTVTAANVSVSGRVLTPKGNGVSRASVMMTDEAGNTVTARTNSFGFYRFDNVLAGQTYIMNVYAKNYQFDPQVVPVIESLSEINFYAQE